VTISLTNYIITRTDMKEKKINLFLPWYSWTRNVCTHFKNTYSRYSHLQITIDVVIVNLLFMWQSILWHHSIFKRISVNNFITNYIITRTDMKEKKINLFLPWYSWTRNVCITKYACLYKLSNGIMVIKVKVTVTINIIFDNRVISAR
jgi:hypothetical protein